MQLVLQITLTIVLLGIFISSRREIRIYRTAPNLLLSLFFISLLIVLPFSMVHIRSVAVILWWLAFIGIFLFAQCLLRDELRLRIVSKIFVIFITISGIWSLYKFIQIGLTSYTRLDGIIGPHNVYGGFLIIPLFLAAYLVFTEEIKWQKYIWYISSAIIVSSIFLTFSRGTWLSIIVALIITGILFWNRFKAQKSIEGGSRYYQGFVKKILIIATFAILMTGGIWQLAKQSTIANYSINNNSTVNNPAAALSNVAVFSGENGAENGFVARLFYFKDAWNTFLTRPMQGFGAGLYASALRMNKIDPNYGSFADPHNWLLKMLVENGVVVTIIFIVFLALLLWQIRSLIISHKRLSWLAILVFAGLVGSMLHGLMDFDWSVNLLLLVFFLFAGSIYGLLLHEAEIKENSIRKYISKSFVGIFAVLVIVASVLSIQILRADLSRAEGDILYYQMNNYDKAIDSYFISTMRNPYEPTTWFSLWRSYYSMKNYKATMYCLKKALAIFPESGIYYTAWAETNEIMNNYNNEYREALIKSIQYFPASSLTNYVKLIDYDIKQKKYDEAMFYINKVLPIYTKYQEALWYKNDPNSSVMSENLIKINAYKLQIEDIVSKSI